MREWYGSWLRELLSDKCPLQLGLTMGDVEEPEKGVGKGSGRWVCFEADEAWVYKDL